MRPLVAIFVLLFSATGLRVASAQNPTSAPNPSSGSFPPREQRYILRPGDVISVEYRYSPEFNATVSIQPDGFASFPGIGSLKVGGLNLEEAQGAVLKKASERLQDPEIIMNLKEFQKPYVIVGGEVGNPGKVEYHGNLTALQAVEMAGGLKTTARSNQILLIRQINNVEAETRLIDLKKVTDKRELAEDIELRAGDMLVVPQSRLTKAERIIRLANLSSYGMYMGIP